MPVRRDDWRTEVTENPEKFAEAWGNTQHLFVSQTKIIETFGCSQTTARILQTLGQKALNNRVQRKNTEPQ